MAAARLGTLTPLRGSDSAMGWAGWLSTVTAEPAPPSRRYIQLECLSLSY